MITNSILPLCAVLASTTLSLGCIATEGDTESEPIALTQEAVTTSNGLNVNGLNVNGLNVNGLIGNALTSKVLTSNALTGHALDSNRLTSRALEDPLSRMALEYIVSCALPKRTRVNVTVEGVDYSYEGQMGLAPEWGERCGSCDQSCQELVSACLLSRLDFLDEHRIISIRGATRALATSQYERKEFTYREATYFGNVFREPDVRLACLAPGRSGIPRVCGPSLDDCAVNVVGSCDNVCDAPAADGSFPNCRDHAKIRGRFPPGTKSYAASLTVFLQP